jgi:hypothetical protein
MIILALDGETWKAQDLVVDPESASKGVHSCELEIYRLRYSCIFQKLSITADRICE